MFKNTSLGGTSGIGPVANGSSYGAMLKGASMGIDYKNGRATMGSVLKSPLLTNVIGNVFGGKAGNIAGTLQTVFGGGGSGEGGKATFGVVLI